jgi:O-antigen/teichoic acid export membrane protein
VYAGGLREAEDAVVSVEAPVVGQSRYHRELVRGVLFNAIGLMGKLIEPLFFLVITWLFGPVVMGGYLLTTFLGDVAATAVTAGYVDAATIFGSHHADESDGESVDRLYQVLGNALAFAVGSSALIVVAAYVGAGPLVAALFPQQAELAEVLILLSWSLPPFAFARIAVAATKARMYMRYDAAIMGFGKPLLLLAFGIAAWALGAGLRGLILAHVGTQLMLAIASGWALSRHFDLGRVATAVLRLRVHRRVHGFALPQSLNMTFNRYIARLDVIMLAAFGHAAAELAFYGTAALITSNLQQVRLVFSTAVAPVAARHHGAGERGVFEAILGQVLRWTTTIIVPLLFVVVVLRADLLRFVHETYVGDTRFMAVLLLPPLFSCALGLAGNCIVYTGHSGWTLANSLTVAALNTGFNWILIPRFGLMGAAIATAVASGVITVAQLVELRALEKLSVRWRRVYKPYVGLGIGAACLALLWDPVTIPGVGARVAVAGGMVVLFVLLMLLVGHEEVRRLVGRFGGSRSGPQRS